MLALHHILHRSLLLVVPFAGAALAGCCCCSLPAGAGGGYTPQASPFIVNANDDDFDQIVLAAEKPVVVDFWASWCGPCAMLDPTVVKLAEEFQDRLQFVRVNVDDSPSSSAEFTGDGIPTLALFARGQFIDSRVGVQPENSLRAWLLDQLVALDKAQPP